MRKTHSTLAEKACLELDRMLSVLFQKPEGNPENTPGFHEQEAELSEQEKKHLAGLMRINHTGEICAQALYYGQAIVANEEQTRKHLLEAASEEQNHLYWCHLRLEELGASSSYLNPLWYISSFALGTIAATFGDSVSYGFIAETERQVESHLQDHIDQLNPNDKKSKKILQQMQADEIRHGEQALEAGGKELPKMVKSTMELMANIMKKLAYRI